MLAIKTKTKAQRNNLDKLTKENDLGADKIKEYCDGLRNEVQLSSEELIQSIKNHSMELIKQIDEYEQASMLNYNKDDKSIQEIYEFHSKWTSFI